jgi:pyruvate dehydrogenase E2 component (dihydrolipoamide acetyltransferase)
VIARLAGARANDADVTIVSMPPANGATPAIISRSGQGPAVAVGGRVDASPVARRLAAELGVDVGAVRGTGPRGRVVKADVQAAQQDARVRATADGVAPKPDLVVPAEAGAPAQVPRPSGPAAVDSARGSTRVVALSRLEQTVARRMAESKATIPEFSLFRDVNMDACVALRRQLGELGDGQHAPSYNDMIVKAAALALRDHPRANAGYRDGNVELYSRINVGIAVAREEGLVVPTVFDADGKSLGEIGRESRRLAAAVRDVTITAPELSGGTFTVTNLGMFGVSSFGAIVNPGQAAILSVGAMARRPVATGGDELTIANVITLGLICDHRVLYGADAARVLARIAELLEQPLTMVF